MEDKMGGYSDFLFARSGFLSGMARVLDVGGTLNDYNFSRDGIAADRRAMAADWAAVGADFRKSIDDLRKELGKPREKAGEE